MDADKKWLLRNSRDDHDVKRDRRRITFYVLRFTQNQGKA
jgi:hypothetical protein